MHRLDHIIACIGAVLWAVCAVQVGEPRAAAGRDVAARASMCVAEQVPVRAAAEAGARR
jgi:hypothetical protein